MYVDQFVCLFCYTYWGACRPPDPPAFFFTCSFFYTGGRAAPQTLLPFFHMFIFLYWGACRPPDPPAFVQQTRRPQISSHHLGRTNLGAPDSALSCGLVRAQLVPTGDPAQDWIDVFCTRYKMIAERDQSRAFQEFGPADDKSRIQSRRR